MIFLENIKKTLIQSIIIEFGEGPVGPEETEQADTGIDVTNIDYDALRTSLSEGREARKEEEGKDPESSTPPDSDIDDSDAWDTQPDQAELKEDVREGILTAIRYLSVSIPNGGGSRLIYNLKKITEEAQAGDMSGKNEATIILGELNSMIEGGYDSDQVSTITDLLGIEQIEGAESMGELKIKDSVVGGELSTIMIGENHFRLNFQEKRGRWRINSGDIHGNLQSNGDIELVQNGVSLMKQNIRDRLSPEAQVILDYTERFKGWKNSMRQAQKVREAEKK